MRFLSPPTAPVAVSLPVSSTAGSILAFNNSLYCYLNGSWIALNNNTTAIGDVSGLTTALAGKEPTIAAGQATQYWRGDKSWQTLDKTAVGLANVDNTSDANKPVSTATASALALKANLSGATFTGAVEFDNAALLANAGITWTSTLLFNDTTAAMTLGSSPPLQVGQTPISNVAIDRFGIQARNNGATSTLNLNLLGGTTNVGGNLTVTGSFSASNFTGSSSGTNSGDQTITLTGDVTGSGTGSFAATIGSNKVTFAKMVAATQAAFIGASSAGNFGEVTPTSATGMLNAFIGATGSVAGTKGLVPAPTTANFTGNTFLKADGTWAQIAYSNITGTPALATIATSGLASDLSGTLGVAQTPAFTGGDVTKSAGSGTLTIGSGVVTLAKMAGLSPNSIIGNNTGVSATPLALTGTQVTAMLDVATGTAKGLLSSSDFNKLQAITGTNTGDQTITLTGDVTGSGTGSFAATIGSNKVTFAKLVAATQAAFIGATAAGNFGELTSSQATAQLSTLVGATSTVAGTKGLVPAPIAGDQVKFLRGDGTWVTVATTTAWGSITGTLSNQSDLNTALTGKLDTSHAGSGGSAHALAISGGAAGFITGSDKAKLDGVSSGATANSTDAFLLDRSNHTGTESITTNTFSATSRFAGRITAGGGIAEELTGTQVTSLLDTATQSLKGLLSATDKTKLDGVATGATANSPDSTLLNRANHTGTQAVTTISFANSSRFLGRVTAGTGTGEEITGTQATALLDVATGTLKGLMSSSDFTKLSGIASGATANSTDAYLLDRTHHTGTQAWSTITSTPTTIAGYGITDGVSSSLLGAANGIATLGSDSKILASQLPSIAITSVYVVANQTAQLALTAQEGDLAVRTDISETFIKNSGASGTMSDWTQLLSPTAPVSSVNGMTGAVTLGKADIGLGNVDNTADTDKPVSQPQQTAFNLKLDATHAGTGGSAHAVVVAGGAAGFITGTDKTKLDGIATGATANQTDSFLLSRTNHTGTEAITTTTFSATARIAGRITSGAGIAEELSGTQVTSMLDVFGTLKGLVPGTSSNTTQFLRADGTWVAPPNTGVWGSITGTLSAQTDLQTALNGKLTWIDNSTAYGPNAVRIPGTYSAISAGDITTTSMATINSGSSTVPNGAGISIDLANFTGGGWLGGLTANSRFQVQTYGTVTGWEFNTAPYVGTDAILTTATGAKLSGGNTLTGDQTITGKLFVKNTALSGVAQIRAMAPVDGSNYGFSEVALGVTNSAATTPDQLVYSFGAEATYTAAGAVTSRDFYIYDDVSSTYRLYMDGTGLIQIGGTNLVIASNGNVAAAGTLSGSNLSGTNTGDETSSTIFTKIGATGGTNYLRQDGTWQTISTSGATGFNTTATGTGSSQSVTLPQSVTAATDILVFVNGLLQQPSTDYTVAGTTLTITTDNNGDSIYVTRPSGMQGQGYQPTVLTQNISGAVTIDSRGYDVLRLTLTGDVTSLTLNGIVDGNRMRIEFIQDAVGGHTITLSNQFAFGTDITGYTATQTANKRDLVGLWVSGTTIYVVGVSLGY